MGKKSRRSNRRGRSTESGSNIPLILRRLTQLDKEALESNLNKLYTRAAHKYQEGLEMIQKIQNSNDPIKNSYRVLAAKASLSLNLIMVEYCRCRFDKVIQIYHDIQMSPEKEVLLSFLCKLHCQLAMLRLDGSKENKDKVVSLIDNRISKGMADPHEVAKALEALGILRNMKEYDSAIDLGEKLGRLTEKRNLSTFENSRAFVGLIGDVGDLVTFENAVTILERYRAEYHRQTGKVSRKISLYKVLGAYIKIGDIPTKELSQRCDAYFIMLAQRDYLCHQVDDKDLSSELCNNAVGYVETYLEKMWHLERLCFTCKQKGTATEVQLVCSGCRFACYCSLHHQRMTWKKDAIQGMRIGHEILCPLMKAYRKWKLASEKGNEKTLELRRRFDIECLYFLSHGLGLKDKCFEEKFMQQFISFKNTCK